MKRKIERSDTLTAQRVEVGLVFEKMLSPEEAADYMQSNRVPESVIKRVLDDPASRRKTDFLNSSHDRNYTNAKGASTDHQSASKKNLTTA